MSKLADLAAGENAMPMGIGIHVRFWETENLCQ
jgi:hypothetical protein